MLYPPEAVAEAILCSAEHPKRDMFVGSQAKLAAVLGALAPRDESAPHKAGYGLHERGSHEPRWLRSRSDTSRRPGIRP